MTVTTSPTRGAATPGPEIESPAVTALLVECASGKATRRSLAVAYAMVIGAWSADRSDLSSVHEAMRNASGLPDEDSLDVIKRPAWAIYDAMVERRARLALQKAEASRGE